VTRKLLRCSFATIGLALVGLAAPALGQETPPSPFGVPGFEIERVSWVGTVAAGGGVVVRNRFGDVRARFGGYEGRVELLGNAQQFANEGARLTVVTEETPAGIEMTVGTRSTETGELVATPVPGQMKRADIVVYVPRGAPLSIATADGLVDVRGLQSDVRASTSSGEIKARKVAGALDFQTASGELLVVLAAWDTPREHALASRSGDLSVVFGGEVDAVVHVATSGLISTDLSMEIDYQAGRRPIRRGRALVGAGSSTVSISSDEGDVVLTRLPLARKARVRPGAAVEP
jgi:hypothetical protein